MARKFIPITLKELQDKIKAVVLANTDWADRNGVHGNGCNGQIRNDNDWADRFFDWKCLTPKIEKDLEKVDFDGENQSCEKEADNPLMGFNVLPNGLNFLGCWAGGDWELAVFFIIYWDGKHLRGYVPTKGNIFDHKTKIAFGSGEPEDEVKAAKQQYNLDIDIDTEDVGDTLNTEGIDFNHIEISQDIEARITLN